MPYSETIHDIFGNSSLKVIGSQYMSVEHSDVILKMGAGFNQRNVIHEN
jgi:hypothetical protein